MTSSRVVPGLVAGTLLLHLATLGRYPLHRDELYLIACGRHLAWGSPDHTPLAPALARVTTEVLGVTPAALRVPAAIAAALVVLWTARLTRRLGGDPTAQAIAAAAALIAPVVWFHGGVYTPGTLELLACVIACERTVAAMQAPARIGRWIAAGAALGLGLLAKPTAALCGLGLLIGLVAGGGRAQLRRSGPWLAIAVALAAALPALIWQARHGGPALAFAASSHDAISHRWSRAEVVLAQPVLLHPGAFALALVGLVRARRGGAVERGLGLMFVVSAAVVVAVPGKPYYLAPAYVPLVALGSIPAAAWLGRRRTAARAAIVGAVALTGALGLVLTLPIAPVPLVPDPVVARIDRERVQFADWRAVAGDLARAHRAAGGSPRLRVLTDSYGTAAAVELYGPALGLPPPISGANGYHLWGPGPEPDALLAVGYPRPLLAAMCGRLDPIGAVAAPAGGPNRYDFPRTIWWCRALRDPMRAWWPRLRVYR